jgi:tRNA A37 N6-isopentenylltransferase MiaA
MTTASPTYLALVGPTCIGKTQYAHDLLREFPLELVNLDSFQVYSFFRVGTGRSDLQTGRAHLYGFIDPRDVLRSEDYVPLVAGALADITARGRSPLFEGGSISYINALLRHYSLELIGLRPRDAAHAVELIEQRVTSTSEELLIAEITEGLARGYRDTVIMRDDVVYLPYVDYLTGACSLAATRERVRKNLLDRYETQMRAYEALPVRWFIPSADSLAQMRRHVSAFLEPQSQGA